MLKEFFTIILFGIFTMFIIGSFIIGLLMLCMKIDSYFGDYIITVDPIEENKETVVYNADYYSSGESGIIKLYLLNEPNISINTYTSNIKIVKVPEGSLNE